MKKERVAWFPDGCPGGRIFCKDPPDFEGGSPVSRNCRERCSLTRERYNQPELRSFSIRAKNSRVSSDVRISWADSLPRPAGTIRSAQTRVTPSFRPRRTTAGKSRKFRRWAINDFEIIFSHQSKMCRT